MQILAPSPNEQFEALGRETLEVMRRKEEEGDLAGLRELMSEDFPILAANLDLQAEFSETQREILHEITEGIHEHSLEVDPVPPIPESREREEETAPQVMQGTLGITTPDTTATRNGSGPAYPR